MAKQKQSEKSDEETLKHYESYDSQPGKNLYPRKIAATNIDSVKKKDSRHKSSMPAPKFIKAQIAVDHVMSKRKSAVIKNPSGKKDK